MRDDFAMAVGARSPADRWIGFAAVCAAAGRQLFSDSLREVGASLTGLIVGLCACLLTLTPLSADQPQRLAELVGSDAAIAVEVPQFRAHIEQARKSRLWQQLHGSQAWQLLWNQKLAGGWQKIDQFLSENHQCSLETAVLELFAEEALFVMTLTPPGDAQGLVMCRAANPAAVERTLKIIEQLTPNATVRNHGEAGQPFFARTPARGDRTIYGLSSGTLLALSDREATIRAVARALKSADSNNPSLASQFAAEPAAENGQTLLRVWIQPRACDSLFRQAADSGDNDAREFFAFWQRIGQLQASIRLDEGVILDGQLRWNPRQAPALWLATVKLLTPTSASYPPLPADAFLVWQSRMNWEPLTALLISEIEKNPAEAPGFRQLRQVMAGISLGRDFMTDILPRMTADFRLWLARSDQPTRAKPAGALAELAELANWRGEWTLNWPAESARGPATTQAVVANLAQLAANGAIAAWNSEPGRPQLNLTHQKAGEIDVWGTSPSPLLPAQIEVAEESMTLVLNPAKPGQPTSNSERMVARTAINAARVTPLQQWATAHGRTANQLIAADLPMTYRAIQALGRLQGKPVAPIPTLALDLIERLPYAAAVAQTHEEGLRLQLAWLLPATDDATSTLAAPPATRSARPSTP